MSDKTLYRIALEYEVAETFAEQVEPDYADEVDINSLADDRFLLAEPDMVVFATVALPSEADQSTLESRLSPVDLSEKRAEIGLVRAQIDKSGEESHVIVTVRPEFDVDALQAEVAEYVRAADGEILVDTIPHVARRDIPEAYFTVHDLSAPTAAQSRHGLFGRFRRRLADRFRPDGAAFTPFGVVSTHAHIREDTPRLTLSEVETPPSAAILP
ncbi:MAG TPA: hypothetical protein VFJ06_01620 [Halococcus sp.]|nr:hypothetical protein [Halococcus sp.]